MIIYFPTVPHPKGLADYWKADLGNKARIKDACDSMLLNEDFEDDDEEEEYCDCGKCKTCRFIDLSFG